jgi:hypothetical protein
MKYGHEQSQGDFSDADAVAGDGDLRVLGIFEGEDDLAGEP